MRVLAGAIKRGDVLQVGDVLETVFDAFRSLDSQKQEIRVIQFESGTVMILEYSDIVERVS
jgi:hypothetical protein